MERIHLMRKCKKFVIIYIFSVIFMFTCEMRADADVLKLENGANLQEAINEADEGVELILQKGTYEGPIVIEKPLSLIGEKGAVIKGNGKGNVITVTANDVWISGLTIQGSGRKETNSGIYLEETKRNVIKNNHMKDVHYGIYINNGKENHIVNNKISSYDGHFSKRGNGIHIFKGKDQMIEKNTIHHVQDGVYFDFAHSVTVQGNVVYDSRYGMHYMFSEQIHTENNTVKGNITGFMIMDSANLHFFKNKVYHQFHFRGVGVFIYETSNVLLEENEIVQNSIALSLERADYAKIRKNVIAANQVGLQFRKGNGDNVFSENNFIGNIVSAAIGNEKIRLDDGKKGNYWDDYKSYDITGDGIGEIPYKAGSVYDHLLKRQPLWQFFFESPAIILWSKAEYMFPSFGSVEVYDDKPLVHPVDFTIENEQNDGKNRAITLAIGLLFIISSFFIIAKGRNYQ